MRLLQSWGETGWLTPMKELSAPKFKTGYDGNHAMEERIFGVVGSFSARRIFLGCGLRCRVHGTERSTGVPCLSSFFPQRLSRLHVALSLCADEETRNLNGQPFVLLCGYFELRSFALPPAG
jgi:hypothetical protein